MDQTLVVLANSWFPNGYRFPEEVAFQLRPVWQRLRDSNPCTSRERAVS
jgi:hypothetical protein